jgi:invasion protein IalB
VRTHSLRFAFVVAAFLFALAFSPGRLLAADRVALIIGNGDYAHTTKLRNPANDAADMGRTLRELGFEVVDGLNLNRQGMEAKIREFSRKLIGAEIALFYYAGHAVQVGGQNYLLPTDAKLEQAGDLELDTLDIQVVLRQMESQVRVNLVFVDACRDNPLARNYAQALGPSRSASLSRGLATVRSTVGTLVAFATEPGNTAQDGTGRNSPFTTALLKHIRTPGVDIGVLMRRVRADVIAATGDKQVPWDHSSLVSTVILVPDAASRPGGQGVANRPQVAALPDDPSVVYSPWTKLCFKDEKGPQVKETCLTVKQASLQNGQFVAGAALMEPVGEEWKVLRITMPLGMQLPQGIRVLLDGDQPMTGRFGVCLPNGCSADFHVNAEFIARLKRGRQIVLQGVNQPGQARSFALPLAEFARANDGPPTDPRKFEEEQKRQRDEQQKKQAK